MSHDDVNDDYRAFYGGQYLAGPNVPEEGHTYVIERCALEEVEEVKKKKRGADGPSKVREKLVVYLRDAKPWIPSRTASGCLAAMWGKKTGGWKGHRVTLFFDQTVRFGADIVGGIRVMGSPELRETMAVEVDLGSRKPPARVTLVPTGRGSTPAPAPRQPTLEDLGLTRAGVDALLHEKGRPAADDSNLGAILARLAHPDSAAALARARELSQNDLEDQRVRWQLERATSHPAADVPPLDQE